MSKTDSFYIENLKKMSGEQKIKILCELTDLTIKIMIEEIKTKFPSLSAEELKQKAIERLLWCHMKNSLKKTL